METNEQYTARKAAEAAAYVAAHPELYGPRPVVVRKAARRFATTRRERSGDEGTSGYGEW